MDRRLWRALRIAGHVVTTSTTVLYASRAQSVRADTANSGSLRSVHAAGAKKAEILRQAQSLRGTYRPSYAFPRWVCDHYIEEQFAQYQIDANDCAVFFDEGDALGLVLQLATEREPVNIGMRRIYNQAEFAALFGWQTGIYGALSGCGAAPNIAIMCPTPVISGLSGPDSEVGERQLREIQDPNNRVYILSVIACAFDSPQQPDQEYFLGQCAHITEAKKTELIARFGRIFDKIFAAALHYDREVIILSKFGAGAFAENYPGDLFAEVWLPAFRAALGAWADRLRIGRVAELSLMGGEREEALAAAAREAGFSSEVYSYFPDPLRRQLGQKLSRSVLVNAWDCWSLIGNGNFADNSLDGFVGRVTALAALGWPITNPYLKDNLVPVKRPS